MRAAERTLPEAGQIKAFARHRGDGRAFDGLLIRGWGQNAGQARSQQGFAATRRTDQQHVVAAGCRDFHGPARTVLAAHIGHVRHRRIDEIESSGGFRQCPFAAQMMHHLHQRAGGIQVFPARQPGFSGVAERHDHPASSLFGSECGRQYTIDGAQFAGQRQFADEFILVQCLRIDGAVGCQNAECQRQIETAAVFGQIGRRQIDRDAPVGKLQLRAGDGGTDAVAAFTHRRFRQTDHVEDRQPGGEIDFNAHSRGLHAGFSPAVDQCKRHGKPRVDGLFGGILRTQAGFQLFDGALQRVHLLAGPQQHRALHVEFLAGDQIEFGQTHLQRGFDVLFEVFPGLLHAGRNQVAETAGQIINGGEIDHGWCSVWVSLSVPAGPGRVCHPFCRNARLFSYNSVGKPTGFAGFSLC